MSHQQTSKISQNTQALTSISSLYQFFLCKTRKLTPKYMAMVHFPSPVSQKNHAGKKNNYLSCQPGLGRSGPRLTCTFWPSACELFDETHRQHSCYSGRPPVERGHWSQWNVTQSLHCLCKTGHRTRIRAWAVNWLKIGAHVKNMHEKSI